MPAWVSVAGQVSFEARPSCSFAYIGFDSVSTAVQEARYPKRDALANSVASMRPRFWRAERAGSMGLPCLVETDGQQHVNRRLIVIHPLWRADPNVLKRLGVSSPGVRTIPIDTFDLERRPLRALEMADGKAPAPELVADPAD
jgi:hypothetical protein